MYSLAGQIRDVLIFTNSSRKGVLCLPLAWKVYVRAGSALCGRFPLFLGQCFSCGMRGVSLGTNFAYPGQSKGGKINNYACYGGRAFGPSCYHARGSVAHRLRRNGRFFTRGCPRVGCLTCFRTCAGACNRLRSLGQGCRRTLSTSKIINLIVNAHPSYVPSDLLSCLRRVGQRAFLLIRCNVRDASSGALYHVGHKRAFRTTTSTIREATSHKVLANKRIVLKLPNRARRDVIMRTNMLSHLPLAALGVRRLRLVENAHVTLRCQRRPRSFRLFNISRCVSLIVSCVRRLQPSLILRHFISRSPGRLLVTPS